MCLHVDVRAVHAVRLPVVELLRRCRSLERCENPLGFHKMKVPQNGWFMMEKPMNMDDLGIPPFIEG
jgi:hypothetical protein